MIVAEQTPTRQLDLIASAVRGAWHEYVETYRQFEGSYDYETEAEPFAWQQLQKRLARIAAREEVLEGSARRTNAAEGEENPSPAGGPEVSS